MSASRRFFSPLFFSPNWPIWLLLIGLNGVVVLCIAAFKQFAHDRAPLSPETLAALAAVPALLLAATAASSSHKLGRAIAVLAGRLGPRKGTKEARHQLCRALLAMWLLCALPVAALSIPAALRGHSGAEIGAAPAALALALLVGLISATPRWGAMTVLGTGLAWLLLRDHWLETSTWVAWQRAWPLHLATLLGLPIFIDMLLPRGGQGTNRMGGLSPAGWLRSLAQRYQPLGAPVLWQSWNLAFLSLFQLWNGRQWLGMSFLADWGVEQDWRWGLRMLLLTVATSALLRCDDLHWRRLVAPGSGMRAQVGLRVLGATLRGLLPIVAIILFGELLFEARLSLDSWVRAIQAIPGRWIPMLAELLLATTISVSAYGAFGERRGLMALPAGILLLLIWTLTRFWPALDGALHWQRGPAHLLACLIATLGLLPMVRHTWRQADLVQIANRQLQRKRDYEDAQA